MRGVRHGSGHSSRLIVCLISGRQLKFVACTCPLSLRTDRPGRFTSITKVLVSGAGKYGTLTWAPFEISHATLTPGPVAAEISNSLLNARGLTKSPSGMSRFLARKLLYTRYTPANIIFCVQTRQPIQPPRGARSRRTVSSPRATRDSIMALRVELVTIIIMRQSIPNRGNTMQHSTP